MAGPSGNKSATLLADGFRTTMPAFGTAVVFSFFTNLLVFVSPLYMLQIYDRVITSRNETTLYGLTIIAGYLLLVYAVLEMLRSRVLVRVGILFDEKIADPIFDAVHRGNLRQPGGGRAQKLVGAGQRRRQHGRIGLPATGRETGFIGGFERADYPRCVVCRHAARREERRELVEPESTDPGAETLRQRLA